MPMKAARWNRMPKSRLKASIRTGLRLRPMMSSVMRSPMFQDSISNALTTGVPSSTSERARPCTAGNSNAAM